MENSEKGENVLIIRWDQILESFGNQNREFGHEILDTYIFSPEGHSLQKWCVSLAALCLSNKLIANASDRITFT